MSTRRVVVTGIGMVTSIGVGIDDAWRNARNGVSGAGTIAGFDPERLPTRIACEARDFEPKDFMPPREARRMDRIYHYSNPMAALRDMVMGARSGQKMIERYNWLYRHKS